MNDVLICSAMLLRFCDLDFNSCNFYWCLVLVIPWLHHIIRLSWQSVRRWKVVVEMFPSPENCPRKLQMSINKLLMKTQFLNMQLPALVEQPFVQK